MRDPEGGDGGTGGGGAPPPVTPLAPDPASWGVYRSSQDAAKIQPYAPAKDWKEAFELANNRLAETQTALRNKGGTTGPARPTGDAATPDALKTYYTAKGLPDSPEAYGIKRPDSVPEEAWDEGGLKAILNFAHENEVSVDLVKKFQEFQTKTFQDGLAGRKESEAKATQEMLVREAQEIGQLYGAKATEKVDGYKAFAQAAGETYGLKPDWFDPHHPEFMGTVHLRAYGALIDALPKGGDTTARTMGNPASTGQFDKGFFRLAMTPGNPGYKELTEPNHPQHEEFQRLRNLAYA